MTKYYMDHFTFDEMACTKTGLIILQPEFKLQLSILRDAFNEGMTVTSCCRSPEYNAELVRDPRYQANPRSLHQYQNPHYFYDDKKVDTLAIDVSRKSGQYAHRLIALATSRGWSVGVAKSFLHLDRRIDIGLQPAIFSY